MLISVIIPNWNAGDLLRDAILSIIDDEAVGEIIVVDNASTDGSADRVAALELPKLVLIRNDKNVGATKARNIALEKASHDIIAFLDADDLLSPGALSNALRRLIDNDLDMCCLQMVRLFADGHVEPLIPSLKEIISGQEAFRRTIGSWRIHPMGVIRRIVYSSAIESFTFHGHSDDELLTRHLFLKAKRVGGVEDQYLYRITPKNPNIQMTIGQVRTNLAVLDLALESSFIVSALQLRQTRNLLVRSLFSAFRKNLHNQVYSQCITDLAKCIRKKPIPWLIYDLPYLMIIYLIVQLSYFKINKFFTRA